MKLIFQVVAMIEHSRARSSFPAFLPSAVVAVVLFSPAAPRAETITSKHDNGKLKEKYSTDKNGKKQGSYTSYYESGKKKVRCRYSGGRLNGRYTEYHETGKTRLEKTYKKGQLSGTVTLYDENGAVLHRAAYKKGRAFLYGGPRSRTPFALHPVPRDKIIEKVIELRPRNYEGGRYKKEKFEVEGKARQPYVAGTLEKEYLQDSLRHLQVYRFLCGLKYDLELHEPFNELAQHAALVSAANRKLDHDPGRPPGMDPAVFELGSRGAGRSNLHQEQGSLLDAIDGFMADEDPSNIEGVGHRAWCLSPLMRRTGLGDCDSYQAMYAFDRSRTIRGKVLDTVLFPNQGHYPVEYFHPTWPWSVTFPTGKYGVPKKSELEVEVWELDEDLIKKKRLELEYLGVRAESYGMGHGIIFRPKLDATSPLTGKKLLASLRWGPTAKSTVGVDYVVDFFSIQGERSEPTDRGGDPSDE